jgi:hypothetical protein
MPERQKSLTDKVTVTNWFTATANRLDFVVFTNKQITAADIDAKVAGGGGVINSIAPPASLAAPVTGARVLANFSAGALQNGPNEDIVASNAAVNSKSEDAPVYEGKQSGSLSHVNWEPIKDFLTHAPATLGETLTEGDRISFAPGFEEPHPESATVLGVNRLIDAIALFGTERNVAHTQGSELASPDPLEHLAAQHRLAMGRTLGFQHAALD